MTIIIKLISTTVVCPSLPLLTNGMISYSDPTLGVGSVATHSCDTGYTLNRGSTRTCQSNGTWSGLALACEGLPLLSALDTWCMMFILFNVAVFIIESDKCHGYSFIPPMLSLC